MQQHRGLSLFWYQGRSQQATLKIADSLGQTKSKVSLECLTEADAGIYECVVSNGHEKKVVATEVRIASKFHILATI